MAKGKVHPGTDHGVGGQRHAPAALRGTH